MTSNPLPTDARRVRLYFALWPERHLAEALLVHGETLQRAIGGRLTRVESIHLTLAFLGAVPETRLDVLCDPPGSIAVPGFVMDFDRLGAWPHNGIGWIAPGADPSGLAQLQSRLSAWLASAGFELEARPFAPHVTLVRKARNRFETQVIEPVRWPVADFCLVRSTLSSAGSRYEVIARFKLPDGT